MKSSNHPICLFSYTRQTPTNKCHCAVISSLSRNGHPVARQIDEKVMVLLDVYHRTQEGWALILAMSVISSNEFFMVFFFFFLIIRIHSFPAYAKCLCPHTPCLLSVFTKLPAGVRLTGWISGWCKIAADVCVIPIIHPHRLYKRISPQVTDHLYEKDMAHRDQMVHPGYGTHVTIQSVKGRLADRVCMVRGVH